MKLSFHLIRAILLAGVMLSAPASSHAQDVRSEIEAVVRDYLANHPDEVGGIVRDYMMKHPEVMGAILAQMLKQRSAANAPASANAAPAIGAKMSEQTRAAIEMNAGQLFSSAHQVNLGNPNGDVTVVEFFDYNCGFCKRALPDLLTLLQGDPQLKIVLKEFPILGPGSIEAARVAVAVRMEDPAGEKYLAFHRELLGSPGPASKDKALTVAQHQGFDLNRLQEDMASPEVAATLTEDMKLASALGITGTPGYVIGNDVVLGAIGVAGLMQHIEAARDRRAN